MSRFSPAAMAAGIVAVLLLVLGLIAVARGGLSGPITEPAVDVAGFSPTPLLGLIEAGTGLALLVCALMSLVVPDRSSRVVTYR